MNSIHSSELAVSKAERIITWAGRSARAAGRSDRTSRVPTWPKSSKSSRILALEKYPKEKSMIGSNKAARSSAQSLVHALVKWDRKDKLQYGQISHPAMVPAKALFRTYAGWSSTLHEKDKPGIYHKSELSQVKDIPERYRNLNLGKDVSAVLGQKKVKPGRKVKQWGLQLLGKDLSQVKDILERLFPVIRMDEGTASAPQAMGSVPAKGDSWVSKGHSEKVCVAQQRVEVRIEEDKNEKESVPDLVPSLGASGEEEQAKIVSDQGC
ncbi:hypothetical protein F2Q69_00046484 [Brassica cretica]|uniref:Uncharacterized protein n=1 Tax=Brassica cretica TaxID=69181 RepID=A0A8S9PPF6_BRACR|nr:hypothetical protein F2Q69_00046484 [Brassica cretica]